LENREERREKREERREKREERREKREERREKREERRDLTQRAQRKSTEFTEMSNPRAQPRMAVPQASAIAIG
jgi:uncharacterized coiled-coil DUF342 family protein